MVSDAPDIPQPDLRVVENATSLTVEFQAPAPSLRVVENVGSLVTEFEVTAPSLRVVESASSIVVEVGPVFYGFAAPPAPSRPYLASPLII